MAVVSYLVNGEKGRELAEELQRNWPHWLPRSFEELQASTFVGEILLEDLRKFVLPHAYGRDFDRIFTGVVPSPAPPPAPLPDFDTNTVLENLHCWWIENGKRHASRHDFDTWPRGAKPANLIGKSAADDPEGWFTFFALGVFGTIGYAMPAANRNFIETAKKEGWWGEMARVHKTRSHAAWTARLDELAVTDGRASDFPQWRRMLADLYVVGLWLPDYVDLFTDLPRLVERHGRIRLSELWWPSQSPQLQRRGTEGASIVRSLGIGANWMVREALRSGFWGEKGRVMHPYGWPNSNRVEKFGQRLGWRLPPRKLGMDASPEIYELFCDGLGERAAFGSDLSLPVHLLMGEKFAEDRMCIFGANADRSADNESEEAGDLLE